MLARSQDRSKASTSLLQIADAVSPPTSGIDSTASSVRLRLVFDPALEIAELDRLGSRRLLLALPAGLQHVVELEQHLRERFACSTSQEQPWQLTVDSFALPSWEPLDAVLRDGDVVNLSILGSSSESRRRSEVCSVGAPAAKRTRRSAAEAVAVDAASAVARPIAVVPPADCLPLQGIEGGHRKHPKDVRSNDIQLQPKANVKCNPSSTASSLTPKGSAVSPVPPVAATDAIPHNWQLLLGALEVPDGVDRNRFINRKLKTLRVAVRRQVEHYFGDKNWEKDEHLREEADANGYVEIAHIATFERLRSLTTDVPFITASLTDSSIVEVSPCGTKLRRRVA